MKAWECHRIVAEETEAATPPGGMSDHQTPPPAASPAASWDECPDGTGRESSDWPAPGTAESEKWKAAISRQALIYAGVVPADPPIVQARRRRLPSDRKSSTRVLRLDSLKVYVTVGEYPDGTPGEIFLRGDKVGSIERGLLEALSLTISLALQHGIPLADLTAKYRNLNFNPQGLTGDAEFPSASSIADYLGQWLESRYGK